MTEEQADTIMCRLEEFALLIAAAVLRRNVYTTEQDNSVAVIQARQLLAKVRSAK